MEAFSRYEIKNINKNDIVFRARGGSHFAVIYLPTALLMFVIAAFISILSIEKEVYLVLLLSAIFFGVAIFLFIKNISGFFGFFYKNIIFLRESVLIRDKKQFLKLTSKDISNIDATQKILKYHSDGRIMRIPLDNGVFKITFAEGIVKVKCSAYKKTKFLLDALKKKTDLFTAAKAYKMSAFERMIQRTMNVALCIIVMEVVCAIIGIATKNSFILNILLISEIPVFFIVIITIIILLVKETASETGGAEEYLNANVPYNETLKIEKRLASYEVDSNSDTYMSELLIRQKKAYKKLILPLIVMSVFVAAGIFMVINANFFGYVFIGFAGLMEIFALLDFTALLIKYYKYRKVFDVGQFDTARFISMKKRLDGMYSLRFGIMNRQNQEIKKTTSYIFMYDEAEKIKKIGKVPIKRAGNSFLIYLPLLQRIEENLRNYK